jgi:hypothetical protein
MPFIPGCSSFGPSALRMTHPAYNEVMARSQNEEFLLNVVRLRYRDTPYFLDVANVTTSQTMFGKANVSADLLIDPFTGTLIKPGLEGSYSQTPTITYMPLQGEDFLKKLLMRIPLSSVLLITQSGASIQRAFYLCLERINDLDNASRASLATPEQAPPHEDFSRLMDILGNLQRDDLIEFGRDPKGDGKNFLLHIKNDEAHKEDIREAKKLLGVSQAKEVFQFGDNFLEKGGDRLIVRTRSLLGILFYLSHAVCVPIEDVRAGLVTVTRNQDGTPFDWTKVSGKLMRVYSSKKKPAGACVSVEYRNSWFYIKDDDLNSKSTFVLLTLIFKLQSGAVTGTSPLLTIPVSR